MIEEKEREKENQKEVQQENDNNLIDIKVIRRELINKIVIVVTIGIIVVILASIAGILVSQAYHNKLIEQYFSQMEDAPEEEEEAQEEIKLPVYSEEAKNRMASIYDGEEKVAYLTFDDGPSTNVTPQILKILEEENVKATFFLLGSRVEKNPELVKQEYEAGHYLANHGYSHDYKAIYSSAQAVLDEYNRTEETIRNAIGIPEYSSYLFRFPGGSSGGKNAKMKKEGMKLLDENNIAHINWNALTRDAEGKPTAESILNDLKKSVSGKNKVVVLMHDTNAKQLTADTLRENISYLREQGYIFKNFYDIMY